MLGFRELLILIKELCKIFFSLFLVKLRRIFRKLYVVIFLKKLWNLYIAVFLKKLWNLCVIEATIFYIHVRICMYKYFIYLYVGFLPLSKLNIFLLFYLTKLYHAALYHMMSSVWIFLDWLIKKLKSYSFIFNSKNGKLFINYLKKILNKQDQSVFLFMYSIALLIFFAYIYFTYLFCCRVIKKHSNSKKCINQSLQHI